MSSPTVLTPEECAALGDRVFALLTAPAAQVQIASSASATTEFARGDAHVASEGQGTTVTLAVEVAGRHAVVRTNRVDEAGLRALVTEAEALAREHRSTSELRILPAQRYVDGPPIYFDATAAVMGAEAQAAVFRQATDAATTAGLVATGDLSLEARARWVRNTAGLVGYERSTYGEFSLTARTQDASGSGWGGGGFEDWGRVDVAGVIGRAVDLAQRSKKPVAVEPGRYTIILEPAAVVALVEQILPWWPARWADRGASVFSKQPRGTNKIGLQMLDQRLGMISDPWDPERPASTIASTWVPIPGPVRWFEQGVLRRLAYDPAYAREKGVGPVMDPGGVRLQPEGPTATLEEMIAATKRGIWVNRLSHVSTMNERTLLLTGATRDGTFLIENGRITKPIKNLRFTDSPFFAFNQVEAWGEPVRASRFVVAPRLKLRDFNFTSLTDAV